MPAWARDRYFSIVTGASPAASRRISVGVPERYAALRRLAAELQLREPRVKRVRLHQFVMRTGAHQAARIDDRDAVDALHRREAVRDDQRGARSHQALERDLHHALGLGIERGGGFI